MRVCSGSTHDTHAHQQVLRLEVTVHHAVLVHVRDALEQLIHEALQTGTREAARDEEPHCNMPSRAMLRREQSCRASSKPATPLLRTLTSSGGSGLLEPLPLRSMYFLRSVLRYSNTRYRHGLPFSSRCSTHSSLQAGGKGS